MLTLAGSAGALGATVLTPAEQALAKGAVDLDILYIGAHPDDEAWALAAFGQWNEFHGQEAGVITITRGEGGGNAVGLEEGPPLGIIREGEERTAVGIAGVKHIFNLDAVDFYYTLSAPLSQSVWGEKSVLSRIIRVVRAVRPEVIVTMNPSAVDGNHGNHQQAARFAIEAYLLAGRRDVFPEHFDEGLEPFEPSRILRSGSNGTGGTGPDAVAQGYKPAVASDTVYGAWNGTVSKKHGKRWSELLDQSIHSYATQGWSVIPPSPKDPEKISASWFTLIDSRTPLADPTSGDDAALRGASLPSDRGGLPDGTRLEVRSEHFDVIPGAPFDVDVSCRAVKSALPQATVALELPKGWTATGSGKLGTVPSGRDATTRFTVTPAKDAAPGDAVLVRAVLSTASSRRGTNVLPLRVSGPVRAGLAPRKEIAQFLEWTESLGMQRLDALVPTRRTLGSGLSIDVDVEARNLSDAARPADVTISMPAGITVTPSSIRFASIPAGGTAKQRVTITNADPSLPTANRAPNGGLYPVTATAVSGGISHAEKQGLNLVPRLVAKPGGTVDVDGERGSSEYQGSPIDIGTLWEGAAVTPEDASGSTWVTFDDRSLSIFVHVVDDVLGTVLSEDDNKQRFRTDSIEIMIDPRGDSEDTSSTFILGVLPDTVDGSGKSAGVAAGRDHDQHQGSLASTAPGVEVASRVSSPYKGYDIEVTVPYSALPNGIDPQNIGFNVVVYDSDTQDRTGQSRIGWSTFPGVQADPYRWGILQLPEMDSGKDAPQKPIIPDTAARSVESPQSILQSASDGVGLGGHPRLPGTVLTIDRARLRGSAVQATVRSARAGSLRAFVWNGTSTAGRSDVIAVKAGQSVDVSVPISSGAGSSPVFLVSLEDESGANAAAAQRL